MKCFSKVQFTCLSFILCIGMVACGGSKKKKSDNPPPPLAGPQIVGDENPSDGGRVEVTALTLGQEASAKGDVIKDENSIFSLLKAYSFKLDKETRLQVRKSYGNANCGHANATFIVMKGDEQVADVTIDRDKPYDGVPVEKLPVSLAPGEYTLIAFVTLDQECKGMMFYYDFYLEEAK